MLRAVISCAFLFFSFLHVNAQTWDGGGDGVNWSSANNWSTNTVPASGGAVIIPNGFTVTVDGDYTCNTLTFTGAAATLQVSTGFTLIVTGAVTINHIATGSNNTIISGSGSISAGSITIGAASPTLTGNGLTKLNVSIASFSCNGNLGLNSRNNSGNNANAAFSLQSGTFTLGGRIIPIISSSVGQGASFLMNEGSANGTLILTNDAPWQTDIDFNTASGWGSNSTGSAGTYTVNLNGANATVVYSRNGDQVINRARAGSTGTVAVTYRNLTLSGTSTLPTTNNKSLPLTSTATITGTLSFQGTAVMTTTNPTYASGSTLEYKGSTAQTTTAFEFLSGATAPSNLIIDNPLGVTLHAARTLRTAGVNSLTLRNGTFNNSSFNVTMASGSTIIRGGGSFQSTPLFPASVNLTYEQTALQITSALEVPTNTATLSNLNISSTNGVAFDRDATVNNTLTLTNGVLTLKPGFTIHITSGNQIAGSGFGLLKHIITEKNAVSGAIAYIRSGAFTGSRTFPLGEGNYYMPATLSSTGSNDFNVAVFSGAAVNGQPNGALFTSLSPIVNANWVINRNTGTTATDITFSWSESLEGEVFSVSADNQIGISRYDGTNWDPIVGINGDNSGNTVTRTGVNTFSPFIVAVINTPLPLKFGPVTASRIGTQQVKVDWKVYEESDVLSYEVQRSENGASFKSINSVYTSGIALAEKQYSSTDQNAGNGTLFYRIRAVELNGKTVYSPIIKVSASDKKGWSVYPNPAQKDKNIFLEMSLPAGNYTLELVDMKGSKIQTYVFAANAGQITRSLQLPNETNPGTYFMRLTGDGFNETRMIFIQ